jgi:hypothetical protein
MEKCVSILRSFYPPATSLHSPLHLISPLPLPLLFLASPPPSPPGIGSYLFQLHSHLLSSLSIYEYVFLWHMFKCKCLGPVSSKLTI